METDVRAGESALLQKETEYSHHSHTEKLKNTLITKFTKALL